MATYSVNWSARLSSTSGTVAAGYCLVSAGNNSHLVATTANRTTYGRTVGISATAGDATTPVNLIVTGLVPPSLTGLAAGTASWVRVTSSGGLERCTPGSGDDIVGKALLDGSVVFHPGVWDSTNVTGSGGGSGSGDLNAGLSVVQGIRGKTVSATAPTIGQELALNNSDQYQPVLRSVHVELFGAVADADGTTQATGIATGTDNAAAFEAAIRSLDATQGGVVHLGFGGYRLARTVIIDRPVVFVGQSSGSSAVAAGTTIWTDYRVTALRIGQGTNGLTVTGTDESGQGSCIRDIQFRAVARDTAVTTATWLYATYSATMPDADAARFSVGQLISIGAANQEFTLSRVVAETTSGSPTVTVTGSDSGSSRGIFAGQYLIIGTAYPAPTRVSSISQFAGYVTVTMASNAATTLADAVVKERPALYARILTKTSSLGTTTLATDMANGSLSANVTGVDVRDASAAIDMRLTAKISHVMIHSFEGPGVYIGTNGLAGWNCNSWQIHDLFTHSCRNAVVCHGQNSQAGTGIGVYSVQSREWAVIEDTQAGNTWIGNHADGGYGFLVRDGCSSTIIGAYHETGTYSSYSSLVQSVGGTGSVDFGGVSDVTGRRNRLDVGDAAVHPHQLVSSPDTEWLSFPSPAVSAPLKVRRSTVAQDGADGYILVAHSGGSRQNSIAFTDDDGPAGYAPGCTIFPQGFMIGQTSANLVDLSVAPRFFRCDDEPTSETFDEFTSGVTWRAGDTVFVTGNGAEKVAILRCIRAGNAAPLWTPSTAIASGARVRLNLDDTYFYTAGGAGTTGTTEPTTGATMADNGITWTRQTASALFERLGGDLKTRARTFNTTPKLVRRVPVADGSVRSTRWIVTVRSTDASGAVLGEWDIRACHKRIGGTLSTAYANVITANYTLGSPGTPTVTLNGNTDVDLNVVGIAATDLTWEISEIAL